MRFPAFMFWPERYWLDAYDLTDAEHGIYLRLLIVQWNCPTCRIPNDDRWIAPKMGRSVQAVETEVKPIIRRFFKTDGNWIWQKKLLEEFDRLQRLSKRGTEANNSRWGKEKQSSETDPTRTKQGVRPTPTPTPTPKKEKRLSATPASPVAVAPLMLFAEEPERSAKAKPHGLNGHRAGFIAFYDAFAKHVARRAAEKAYAAALKRGATPEQILEGAKRYAKEREGEDPKFTKQPATWLNADCWLDAAPSGTDDSLKASLERIEQLNRVK